MLNSFFDKEKWSLWVVKANQFFSRPLGILLAIAAMILIVGVYFAYSNTKFLEDNKILLENTSGTVENTHAIAQDTKQIIASLEKAVIDLKADNEQQTLILCRMIVRSNLSFQFEPDEEEEIEEICRDEIERQATQNSEQAIQEDSPQVTASNDSSGNTDVSGGSQNGNEPDPTPTPPEEQGFIESLTEPVTDFVDNVTQGLDNFLSQFREQE